MSLTSSGSTRELSISHSRGNGKLWLAIGIEALVIVILSSVLSFEYANSPFFQSYVNTFLSEFGGLIFWNLLVIAFVFSTAYYAVQRKAIKD